MLNCDIIIPVFNAFDCLQNCFESVLNNTNLHNNRLIIIDDKSNDKRVVPYIESIISLKEQNIVFIKNEENLGFIKTVNIGMKFSGNDVLLLNSDTEVTEDWLDKIQKCAYSKERIATVTPLSNNATIASVPKYNKANEIPNGYNLYEYQKLIDRISYREYPEIPTGIGFCLFIRREALDTVGLFDEEAYGKAYGEEEDFCYRCLGYGYRHILCDDVIVFHKSSQSFTGYYKEVNDQREKTLMEKYPLFRTNTARWFFDSPLNYINKNINYNICINNGKSNILIIIHAWDMQFDTNELIGGTSLHVSDIIQKLRNKYNFHVLSPFNGIYHLYSYWENGEESIDITSLFSESYTNGFFNLNYSLMLKTIIDVFKIDIIHIHHMLCHYFDLIDILKNEKIRLFISLHDFFSICPRINKINNFNLYCANPNTTECNFCLSSYFNEYSNYTGNNIEAWKKTWGLLFSLASKIIVPSEATRKEIFELYKNLSIDVVDHGVDSDNDKKELDIETDKEFHVAFLGGITAIKGKQIIEELIKYSNQINDNIYYHLFGYINSNILKMKYKKFFYHGKYVRKKLNYLFKENNIKLVCIFSICPETYSYTLTESVVNNIPVLAINIGTVGQRIRENNLGWLIENGTGVSEIYNKINKIFHDKHGYKMVNKSITNYKIKSVEEMINDYDKIYSSYKINRNENKHTEKLKAFIKENYLHSITYNKNLQYKLQYQLKYEKEKQQIYESYSWRVGSIVTWFPRKTKGLIKCYLGNGIKYTIKLFIKKLFKEVTHNKFEKT